MRNKSINKNKESFFRFAVKYFLPLIFWLGFIFYLSNIPSLASQSFFNWKAFLLRKIAHIFEYSVLNILFLRFFIDFKKVLNKKVFFKFVFISAACSYVYAVSDEIHQMFILGREASTNDVMFDLFGILLSSITIVYFHSKFKFEKQKIN